MDKKAWIDKLYYKIGKQTYDFELTAMSKKDGNPICSKWRKYSEVIFPLGPDGSCDDWKLASFFKQANNRTILPIEIVLDLEEVDEYKTIQFGLDTFGFKYYLWKSGSRGYHFSLFFDEPLTKEEKLILIKHFACDEQKAIDHCTIALEYAPHWKTGKNKRLINYDNFPEEVIYNKRSKLYELQEQDRLIPEEQESY